MTIRRIQPKPLFKSTAPSRCWPPLPTALPSMPNNPPAVHPNRSVSHCTSNFPQLDRVQRFERPEKGCFVRNLEAVGAAVFPAPQPTALALIEPASKFLQCPIASGDSAHQSQEHDRQHGGWLMPQPAGASLVGQLLMQPIAVSPKASQPLALQAVPRKSWLSTKLSATRIRWP